jgi:hypothetical protein
MSDRDRLDATKMRALNHPLRLRILEMHQRMRSRPLSVKAITEGLADTLEYGHVSPAEVKYHHARLQDAKLIPVG